MNNLRSLFHHNVPRFISHIKSRGLSEEEWHWLQCEEENANYPLHVINHADRYLFYPRDEEIFNHGLLVLVKAIAIMSFIPEGVRIFGLHFCSEIDNFVAEDGSQEI
jgi:hypothetical protein